MTTPSYVWLADGRDVRLAEWESVAGRFDLECPSCGQCVFMSGLDGFYYETDSVPCPACGNVLSVGIDEAEDPPQATVIKHDETQDFGQPACDGSGKGCVHPKTGPREEFVGAKCDWECSRVDHGKMIKALLEGFGAPTKKESEKE